MKNFYIPIKSTSLSHILEKALILPANLYENKPEDIQNIASNYIVLSKKRYISDSNCSIEVVLNDDETKELKGIDENLFLYKQPIPISRIKNIYFMEEEEKKRTIFNIEQSTAFVNKDIVEVVKEESLSLKKENIQIDKKYFRDKKLIQKIELFDQILGGVAFVRYDIDGKYMKIFPSIVSYFNKYIESIVKEKIGKIEEKYKKIFETPEKYSTIYQLIDKDIKEQLASKNIIIKDNLLKLEDILKNSAFLSILFILNSYKNYKLDKYGDKSDKMKSTQDLINDFENGKLPKDKKEAIFLYYGIHNGYSTFNDKYEKNKIVKFKMDSIFDYYIIESIFQYVFNKKKDNGKFNYLDKNIQVKKKHIFNIDNIKFKTYNIMDETIILNEKTIIGEIEKFMKKELFEYIGKIIKEKDNKIEQLQEELENTINKLNSEIQKQKQKLEEKDEEIKQLQDSKKNLENNIKEKDNKIEQLQKDKECLEKKLKNQKELIQNLEYINELEKKSKNELLELCKKLGQECSRKDNKKTLINKIKEKKDENFK